VHPTENTNKGSTPTGNTNKESTPYKNTNKESTPSKNTNKESTPSKNANKESISSKNTTTKNSTANKKGRTPTKDWMLADSDNEDTCQWACQIEEDFMEQRAETPSLV
jgi:hypothetical protein